MTSEERKKWVEGLIENLIKVLEHGNTVCTARFEAIVRMIVRDELQKGGNHEYQKDKENSHIHQDTEHCQEKIHQTVCPSEQGWDWECEQIAITPIKPDFFETWVSRPPGR